MASLPNIEIKFWSPLQLDYSTGGKAAPALNIVCLKKKSIIVLGVLPLQKVWPLATMSKCVSYKCVSI